MKTLKFQPALCDAILSGDKTTTWRLFDDKQLQMGDELEFVNSESKAVIGRGGIVQLTTKTLGTLDESDWEGQVKFASEPAMYEAFRGWYGNRVGPDTEVKIVHFDFTPS